MIRPEFHPQETLIGKVTGRTAHPSIPSCWTYQVAEVLIHSDLSTTTVKTSAVTAYSISELSNNGSTVSYGVPVADIPTGFAPVGIPVGSFVFCRRTRLQNGTFIYIIVNTQSISGECQ